MDNGTGFARLDSRGRLSYASYLSVTSFSTNSE